MSQIDDLKAAGFSDEEIGAYNGQQRQTLSGAGFSDEDINQYLSGSVSAPKEPPKPWLERLRQGGIIGRVVSDMIGDTQRTVSGAVGGAERGWEVMGGGQPAISPENEQWFRDLGIFADPAKGAPSPLQFTYEALARPIAGALNTMSAATGAIMGAGAGAFAGSLAKERNNSAGSAERDLFQLGQAALIGGIFVEGPEIGPTGEARSARIGTMPTDEDFANAARATVGPAAEAKVIGPNQIPVSRTETKLLDLFNQRGIAPAEVAADAESDVTVTQALASAGTDLPERYVPPEAPVLDAPAPGRPSAPEPPAIPTVEPPTATGIVSQAVALTPPTQVPNEIPNAVTTLRPDELLVDAARFQFKTGGDEAGVTERLRGVEQWDPIKAGLVLAWEDNNGQKFIVDGHQRLGLAQRIAQADPAQDPILNALLLREADGVSDIEARTSAAAKNMAEGTGTAVDAAKVLRDAPPEFVKTLPPQSELVRQARGLANLDPEAFGMVANDVVPPNYGAIVGHLAPDDPKMQGALLELLAKTEPANAVQAESIVRQGLDAGTREETQATLFGDQVVASSLFLDRAKVLDRTLRQLKRDRDVFSTIVKEEDVLSAVGNKLESGANAQRAATDAQAVQILQTLANRRGPLSDALAAAANTARDSGNYAAAARDFAAAVRAQMESGDLVRGANGLERGRGDAAGENAASTIDPAATIVRPADEAAASERAADLIGSAAPEVRYKLVKEAPDQDLVQRVDEAHARRYPRLETYSIRNETREAAEEGYLEVRFSEDGKEAYIENVQLNEDLTSARDARPNQLGVRVVRQLLRQLQVENPEIETISGNRVSGARQGGAYFADTETPIQINVPRPRPGQLPSERVSQLVEATEQGEQLIIPGAERTAQQAVAAREQQGRGMMRPGAPQEEPGGMFAPPEAEQPGLEFGPETGAIAWGRKPPPAAGSLEEAQDSILNKLSIGEPGQKRGWSWGRLYTNVFDKLYPVSRAVGQAANGVGIPTEGNPYQLARLTSGLAGKITGFLNEGTRDWRTYAINGEGLKDVLDPVKDRLDAFRVFATAARGLELEARGITTGLDAAAMQHVAREGVAEFGPTLDRLVDYQNRVAAYARDAGLISRDGYDAMVQANQLYVPFQRVMGDGDGVFRSAAGSLQPGNPLHRILGSERDVIDPVEGIIRNTATMITMAEKNNVVGSLRDMLTAAGQVGRPGRPPITPITLPPDPALDAALRTFLETHGVEKPEGLLDLLHAAAAQPADVGTIRVFDNGTPHAYQVDPELATAVKGLDGDTTSFIEKIMAPFARVLRGGAVLNPDFMIRHTFRDFLYASVTNVHGLFTPMDMARGFYGLINKDDRYWNWLQGGGANISMVSLDRRYLQESIDKMTENTGLMTRALNVVGDPNSSWLEKGGAIAGLPFRAASKYVLHPLQLGVELAENASHLGAFIKESQRLEELGVTGREQIQRAAFTSRDVAVDAARIGAKTRAYNMITAFANITLQDTDRVVRAFVDDPVSTSLKVGAYIVGPSALLWWANHEDPRYKELPDWQKDMFWVFPTDKWEDVGPAGQYGPPNPGTPYRVEAGRLQVNNGAIFRLPKPWGMGVIFGSGVERALEAFSQADPAAFQHWGNSIASTVVPQFYPTAVAPVLDQWTNRNTFTNRTLIPGGVEKLMPEYQYTPYTTETAKAIGRLVGAFPGMHDISMSQDKPVLGGIARALTSPILIENYVRGWSGNLGNYTLQLADAALRKEGILPDPPQPTKTLADIPVIRAFTIRYPSATTQSIQDFEDRYNQNKMYYDTWMAKAKDGDEIAANRIMQAGGPRIFVQLDAIQKTLNEHNQLIRDVYKDTEMKPSDKRQLIDTIYYRMIEVGQAGKAALAQIDTALRTPP